MFPASFLFLIHPSIEFNIFLGFSSFLLFFYAVRAVVVLLVGSVGSSYTIELVMCVCVYVYIIHTFFSSEFVFSQTPISKKHVCLLWSLVHFSYWMATMLSPLFLFV